MKNISTLRGLNSNPMIMFFMVIFMLICVKNCFASTDELQNKIDSLMELDKHTVYESPHNSQSTENQNFIFGDIETKTNEVKKEDNKKINNSELLCLAKNIYFEAGGESEAGMIAVANVTIHRKNNKNFPDTVCGVVYYKKSNSCAFSWTCDRNADTPKRKETYDEALRIATLALKGKLPDVTFGADHFHARHVRPMWTKKMKFTTKIGAHLFYRIK